MKRLAITLIVLGALVGSVHAYDFETPRGIGQGRTIVLSNPRAADLLRAGTPGLTPGAWAFDAGYNRRFELSDLDQFFIAGGWGIGRFGLAVGASQTGDADLYAEQLLQGSVSFRIDSLRLGASLSGMQVQFGGRYGELRAATFGLGVSYRYRTFIGALNVDNITSPRLLETSEASPPRYSFLSEYVSGRGFSFTARTTFEPNQPPQFALGQIVALSERGNLFWGIATGPMEYGAGLEIKIPSGVISYATSVHPVLGLSHTVTLSLGSTRPSQRKSGEFD